jgi:hypothetical protein
MNFTVNSEYVFKDAVARDAFLGHRPGFPKSIQLPGMELMPKTGDLLKISPADDSPTFVVLSRTFIWESPSALHIQLLLDLVE